METDNRPERLRTSAARLASLKAMMESEFLVRNQLIVEMVDDGYGQGIVREWSGLKSNSSITHLLARPAHQHMIIDTEVQR
jgi:hypothetical protein